MTDIKNTAEPKVEELNDAALDDVQGGNWFTQRANQAAKTMSSVSKKLNDTANSVIKNI